MNERKCGTCKWWKGPPDKYGCADCVFQVKLPDSVYEGVDKEIMFREEGTECECWEPSPKRR